MCILLSQCRSLRLYKDYVEMYRAAVECLKKHRQENETFMQFIEVKKSGLPQASA